MRGMKTLYCVEGTGRRENCQSEHLMVVLYTGELVQLSPGALAGPEELLLFCSALFLSA